jgi:hypothetical protein
MKQKTLGDTIHKVGFTLAKFGGQNANDNYRVVLTLVTLVPWAGQLIA